MIFTDSELSEVEDSVLTENLVDEEGNLITGDSSIKLTRKKRKVLRGSSKKSTEDAPKKPKIPSKKDKADSDSINSQDLGKSGSSPGSPTKKSPPKKQSSDSQSPVPDSHLTTEETQTQVFILLFYI